ncbi:hypothetical protein ASE85_02440 [Sphingobium sp. Leaf26]|uniref:hypothetical protein n=1 Tax=Sphingobium sp. Leaf26 TaxID=1735693 RepID=UPI0006FF12A4|nr:hypothetical protein [Sphingobium sp. Leaf26]KQN09814.1 hypothetical protein ASE85_02440 [Sphingobium sp. Leaf26]
MTEQDKDMAALMAMPAFRRFLWRSIQSSGILGQGTNGADGRDLSFAEGRRSQMLAILADCDVGQPVELRHPHHIMTLIAVMREEANPAPKEKKSATGRYDELPE